MKGKGGNSSHDIIRRMNNFKVADIYVLLVGTNDRKVKIPVDSTVKNINTIVTHLRGLNNNARIYLLTTLPCVEAARDSENQQINVLLKSQFPVGANNITVLDTEKLFRDKEDWRTLMLDGLHPNGAGYRLLTGFLNENIK